MHEQAEQTASEALSSFESLDDTWGQAMSMLPLAWVAYSRGDFSGAQDLAGEAVGLAFDAKDPVAQGFALAILAWFLLEAGDLDRAEGLVRRTLEMTAALGLASHVEAAPLAILGNIARARGDLETAREHLSRSVAAGEAVQASYFYPLREVRAHLSQVCLDLGDLERAAGLVEAAIGEESEDVNSRTFVALATARVRLAQGREEEAAEALADAVGEARAGPCVPRLRDALAALADFLNERDPAEANRLRAERADLTETAASGIYRSVRTSGRLRTPERREARNGRGS